MSRFCSKCGARVVDDSIFCESCGSKLKPPPKIAPRSVPPRTEEPSRKPVFNSYNKVSSRSGSPSHYRPYYRSSSPKGIKWLFVGVFFIAIIGFAAVLFFVGIVPIAFNGIVTKRHKYIGDKTYSIDDLTNTSSLELDIDNSFGDVHIEITNMTNVIEAQILVYAKEGHRLRDANTFEDTHYDNLHYVSFDSSSGSYQENPYYYELEIAISNLVTTALDVDVSTGSIFVEARETNISFVSLGISTGSITCIFQDVVFETANNLTMHTSTGSITASFIDINYDSSDEVEWIIYTSTGSIDLDIIQEVVFNHTQINYNVDVSTGSINFVHELHHEIGLLYYADVSTGEIYTENSIDDHFPYESENYTLASMKFYLSMDVSTGSISITSF
ncbi:MAG: zinc ribbon domain-containing protein [Candidatus Hodarchaeales archaeon]|jgi:hypothetical protein